MPAPPIPTKCRRRPDHAESMAQAPVQRPAPSSRETLRAASVTAWPSPRAGPRGRIRSVSPTTPIAPTAWPALSWIARGDARLAEHRLVALAREAALADGLELPAQRRGGQRAVGELLERLRRQVVEHRRLRVGEHRLAERRRVRGQLRADLEHLEDGVGPEDVVHDDDGRAVQDADAHGRLRARREALRMHERARPQLVVVEVGVAEVQQARAELVLVGVAVLLDEAVRLQGLQQAVDGRPRHPELVGELRHAEAPRPGGERLEDPRRAVDGLDRAPPATGAQIICIRHCRIGFDSLE